MPIFSHAASEAEKHLTWMNHTTDCPQRQFEDIVIREYGYSQQGTRPCFFDCQAPTCAVTPLLNWMAMFQYEEDSR